MEELSYTSKFDGETTDDILGYANEGKTEKVNEYVKSMNVQDSEGEPDTVQVYDTDGVPHKVSKTELLKKSTLALPKLEDISSFVAVNAAGNAVGVMTKEQVASVLAELIGTATLKNDGLMSKSGFLSAIGLNLEGDANNVNNGVYKFDSQQDNMPVNYGILVAFSCDGWIRMQLCAGGDNGLAYIRMHYNSWTSWKQL
ncbi:hypothetical protein [Phocaeicola plebeius]|jgi:hypothetical protein|uniref:hypothetical protein n=2 Tax=Phocaeicola plebeius TaxID=310297 RepID=UPI0026EAA6AC|nr:hypothetical protein [Phocaeicola plebeius]